ncbi:MAG TPA: 3-isopropylmalate dehydratase small subunit [Ramlibacter sp.]|uniref:3-isopropylmalate dehydratase small subunit n=1 Tax=Ramlibacter sp. TaxID=1917967 RepID=UPI002B7D18B3|nr:3-isopropylmalate dehydratase small subunit [Ramlibacter sp.]HVZ42193.1 3-isopropylmalate dehydratase small subunit [Ramlibacter sp.]
MEVFDFLGSVAVPLPIPNLNTDVIVRVERLTSLQRTELGPYAFEALRYRADGTEDPGFILNRAPFREAKILVAGENFGCGSSREGAVWALMDLGIRCVIAPSFGEIFFNNCFHNGMLAIALPAPVVATLLDDAASERIFQVDLPRQQIRISSCIVPFSVDPVRKEFLLRGLDGIGLTLRAAERIAHWQANDRRQRPWAWAVEETGNDPPSR